jgi:hypothetical protein
MSQRKRWNMRFMYRQATVAVTVLGFALWGSLGQAGAEDSIGMFTTIEGTVRVTHLATAQTQEAKINDEVFFRDVIETEKESRTKAFLEDESILSVGENSRVEVSEYVYHPEQNVRSAVIKLLDGKLRALVAKAFKGPGSRFEIHTPTAVAAARGTYFVVWSQEGTSGIVNIGETGRVDFTAQGKTVPVDPGHYSVALPGQPPLPPAVYVRPAKGMVASNAHVNPNQGGVNEEILAQKLPHEDAINKKVVSASEENLGEVVLRKSARVVDETVLKDRPRAETPKESVRAVRMAMAPSTLEQAMSRRPTAGQETEQIVSRKSSGTSEEQQGRKKGRVGGVKEASTTGLSDEHLDASNVVVAASGMEGVHTPVLVQESHAAPAPSHGAHTGTGSVHLSVVAALTPTAGTTGVADSKIGGTGNSGTGSANSDNSSASSSSVKKKPKIRIRR